MASGQTQGLHIDGNDLVVNLPRIYGDEVLQKRRNQTLHNGSISVEDEFVVNSDLVVLVDN